MIFRWQPNLFLISCGVFAMAFGVGAEVAQAQLFGDRELGRGSQPRRSQGREVQIDQNMELRSILEEGRFMRETTPGGFVGGQARRNGIVGVEQSQAAAPIRSAIDQLPTLDTRRASAINRPLPPLRPTDMYPPRFIMAAPPAVPAHRSLSLASPRDPQAAAAVPANVHLERVLERHIAGTISVSLEGRIATLSGEVASEHDRNLARLLLSFEPGIDSIQNELTVAGSEDR